MYQLTTVEVIDMSTFLMFSQSLSSLDGHEDDDDDDKSSVDNCSKGVKVGEQPNCQNVTSPSQRLDTIDKSTSQSGHYVIPSHQTEVIGILLYGMRTTYT